MGTSYGVDDDAAAAAEAQRALHFIETHLSESLTVARIAAACDASAFHFSRRFAAQQGESVMAYVRGRRLDKAADRLLSARDVGVVDIALESGFESQAAFTRAFTRAFGSPPHKYRRMQVSRGRSRRARNMFQPILHETLEELPAIRVAGLTGTFDPSSYVEIAALWQRSASRMGFAGRLGDGETIGVFRHRNLAAQSFEHMAGVRIADDARLPAEFSTWSLAARTYLVFKQMLVEGDLHPQVAAAQSEIWNVRLPRSGRVWSQVADFQVYPANFKVGPGGWLMYYIPVE